MMRKKLWMMSAFRPLVLTMVFCGVMMMLTSCSKDDNATAVETEQLGKTIEGLWWTGFNQNGSVVIDASQNSAKQYSTVIYAYKFYADGGANYMKLLLDENGDIVKCYGSLFDATTMQDDNGTPGKQVFNYNTTADGVITMTNRMPDTHDYTPATWHVTYLDGCIAGTDGDTHYELQQADEQVEKILGDYSQEANEGGEGAGDTKEDAVYQTLDNVKYEIIKDTAMWKYSILSNVYRAVKIDHDVEAELEKMRNEAEKPLDLTSGKKNRAAATRSITDPKIHFIPSGYRYIDYTYESVDEQGKPIKLSSRVCWGVSMGIRSHYKEYRPCDLVLCAHSTISDNLEAPSMGGSPETLMLQGDRVLILPDYIGYGVTKDRVHPYINHELCARNCIDALKAGYKIFRDKCKKTLHPQWNFYVIGASQGGGNALAIHKWLDTHEDFANLWRFKYSYCAAGPYNPALTFKKYFEQKVLDYPVVMPLALKAMIAAYPDILGKWKEEDFYSETYLKHKADIDLMISSKKFLSTEINKKFFEIFPHTGETGIKPGKQIFLTDILNPDVCDENSEKSKALFQCFAKSDLTKGWTPVHPIHLYHGKNDTYVSYANSEAVKEAFPEKATLKEPAKVFSDHIKTCVFWMLSVSFGMW